MPFLTLNNDWSKLADRYNQAFTNKPEIPRIRYNNFDDGLIRGGVLNVGISAIRDTARIGRFYLSGRGASFLIKQVGLQKANPKLEELSDTPTLSRSNTRLYNLGVNTLAQVPVNALGGHIIRHGILPVGGVGFLEGDSRNNIKGYNYENIVLTNDRNGKNRLIGYLDKIKGIDASNTTPIELSSYNGGAASVYGIGKTFITTTTLHTNNSTPSTLSYSGLLNYFDTYRSVTDSGFIPNQQNIASGLRNQAVLNRGFANIITNNASDIVNPFTGEVTNTSDMDRAMADRLNRNAAQIDAEAAALQNTIDQVNNNIADNDFSIFNHPLYRNRNIQSRLGTSTSKYGPNNVKNAYKVDSINAIDIVDSKTFYDNSLTQNNDPAVSTLINKGNNEVGGYFGRDIIKFRIEFLNNDNPVLANASSGQSVNTDVLAFRAYLDGFDDGMTAKWNSFRYMGRGEEFYVYEGFTRDVSVAFTVFAHSPEEMRPIYRKLNYLMSSFAPDYNAALKMRGNISYLTVGDYLYRQPGIFTDIKLSGMLDSNWEIAMDAPEKGFDKGQYELPKLIKVNLSFKPIHTFLPRKVQAGKYADTPFITLDKKAYPAQAGASYNKDGSVKTTASNKYLD
jgi:hypothetical protein